MSSVSLPSSRIRQTLPGALRRTSSYEILRTPELHLKIEEARASDPRFVPFFHEASKDEPGTTELSDEQVRTHYKSFGRAQHLIYKVTRLLCPSEQRQFEDSLNSNSNFVDQKKLLASGVLKKDKSIWDIRVIPEWRKNGIAIRLMEALIHRANKISQQKTQQNNLFDSYFGSISGEPPVRVYLLQRNKAARNLYEEKLNFKPSNYDPVLIRGKTREMGEPVIEMSLNAESSMRLPLPTSPDLRPIWQAPTPTSRSSDLQQIRPGVYNFSPTYNPYI